MKLTFFRETFQTQLNEYFWFALIKIVARGTEMFAHQFNKCNHENDIQSPQKMKPTEMIAFFF